MFGGVILSDRDVQAVVISDMWGHVPCWQRYDSVHLLCCSLNSKVMEKKCLLKSATNVSL